MKKIFTITCLAMMVVFSLSFKESKKITGEQILQKMHKRYAGNWFKTFTFSQKTETFRNDTLFRTAIWHEAIVYPHYFRISFGDVKDGNAVIYIKDSSFNFSKGKLVRKGLRGDDLTFLLGGMHFFEMDSVKIKMKKEGFDISKAHETKWNGRKYYVLGTTVDDEKGNQLWIDKEKLIVIRFIKYDGKNKEEALFGDHVKIGKAWTETSCSFLVNDKLIQKEVYYDYAADKTVDMSLFDPYNFKK